MCKLLNGLKTLLAYVILSLNYVHFQKPGATADEEHKCIYQIGKRRMTDMTIDRNSAALTLQYLLPKETEKVEYNLLKVKSFRDPPLPFSLFHDIMEMKSTDLKLFWLTLHCRRTF